jgi:hypothetical protein
MVENSPSAIALSPEFAEGSGLKAIAEESGRTEAKMDHECCLDSYRRRSVARSNCVQMIKVEMRLPFTSSSNVSWSSSVCLLLNTT